MPHISPLLMLIVLTPVALYLLMLVQGILALRDRAQDRLTLEAGLEAVRQRLRGREYIQSVIAVGGVAALVLGGLAVFGFLSATRAFSFFGSMTFALCIVASSFLVSRWMRRITPMQAVQALERSYSTDARRSDSLSRLVRTYVYYKSTKEGVQPALFHWVRREVGVFLSGLDLRAHFAVSVEQIFKRMAILTLAVLGLAMILSFSCGAPFGLSPLSDSSSPGRTGDPQQFTPESESDEKTGEGEPLADRSEPPPPPENREESMPPERMADEERSQNEPSGAQNGKTQATGGDTPGGRSEDGEPPQEPLAQQASGKARPSPDTEPPGVDNSLFSRLMKGLQDMLGSGESEESGSPTARPQTAQQGGAPDAGHRIPQPARAPAGGGKDPSGAPAGHTGDPDRPPSDRGEGASGRARISRGDGGDPLGRATSPPADAREDGALLRLDIDRVKTPTQTTRDVPRPQPYNAAIALNPDDVTVTPAAPLVTQRIPKSYQRVIKRLLSKHE